MNRDTLLLGLAGLIGALVGGYLGLRTEHGVMGIITIAAAGVRLVAGVYVGQLIATGPRGEE